MKTLPLRKQGFTLIEILIVITVIGVLAALTARALGDRGGMTARDAIRISEVQQIATIVGSLQGRFHIPPLSSATFGKYSSSCKGTSGDLGKCLKELKVMPDNELNELLSDPKQDLDLVDGQKFYYAYGAVPEGFKVCSFLEDQGAVEDLNANESGLISADPVTPTDGSKYMHCIVVGKKVEKTAITKIIPPEISK